MESRSWNGCLTCRARKIKCDERPNACLNCERIAVACPGYATRSLKRNERAELQSNNSAVWTEAGIKRSRLLRSCNTCRQAKTKCSGGTPPCSRCHDKGLTCKYETPKRTKGSQGVETSDNSNMANQRSNDERCLSSDTSTLVNSNEMTDSISSNEPSLSWLMSTALPDPERIRKLVESYFINIHPLGSFGFIHKPSFKEKLDLNLSDAEGHEHGALLYAVCALGAKFYALEYQTSSDLSHVRLAGCGWASESHDLLCRSLSAITIENLMAAVLLYDYQVRVGNFAGAFVLTGIAMRMVLALQINVESSTDVLCSGSALTSDVTVRESRPRLLWTCFVMDIWVSGGVDQITLLDESNIEIQLPCNDRNFMQQIPCITETLQHGQVLDFVPKKSRPADAATNMGLVAYFIRIAGLRKKVQRFVKSVDMNKPSHLLTAEFAALDAEFKQWFRSLPATVHLDSSTMYVRKETNQLPALFLLHCVYHSSICELYSFGDPRLLPSLMRHRYPIKLPTGHREFLAQCRETCYEHAKEAAIVLGKAVKHGPKALSDVSMPIIAFESIRIIWCQITTINTDNGMDLKQKVLEEVLPLLRAAMEALRLMIPLFAIAKRCYQTVTTLIRHVGLGPHLHEWTSNGETQTKDDCAEIEGPSIRNGNASVTPESILNPLEIYSLARMNIDEKHMPEEMPAVTSEANVVVGNPVQPPPASGTSLYGRQDVVGPPPGSGGNFVSQPTPDSSITTGMDLDLEMSNVGGSWPLLGSDSSGDSGTLSSWIPPDIYFQELSEEMLVQYLPNFPLFES